MTLIDFLTDRAITMVDFAKTVGTTPATISRVVDGLVVPRRELMRRIHTETDGNVTPNDLIGLFCILPCPNIINNEDH